MQKDVNFFFTSAFNASFASIIKTYWRKRGYKTSFNMHWGTLTKKTHQDKYSKNQRKHKFSSLKRAVMLLTMLTFIRGFQS